MGLYRVCCCCCWGFTVNWLVLHWLSVNLQSPTLFELVTVNISKARTWIALIVYQTVFFCIVFLPREANFSCEYCFATQECCICLYKYVDGVELCVLPCNHHFHHGCISKWLRINATCPLCKFNILRGDTLVWLFVCQRVETILRNVIFHGLLWSFGKMYVKLAIFNEYLTLTVFLPWSSPYSHVSFNMLPQMFFCIFNLWVC